MEMERGLTLELEWTVAYGGLDCSVLCIRVDSGLGCAQVSGPWKLDWSEPANGYVPRTGVYCEPDWTV